MVICKYKTYLKRNENRFECHGENQFKTTSIEEAYKVINKWNKQILNHISNSLFFYEILSILPYCEYLEKDDKNILFRTENHC